MGGGVNDEELYAATAGELTRFATSLVGPSDACDVVADAVWSAMRSRAWAKVQNKRAFLFRSVLFTARSWRRTEKRRRARDVRLVGAAAADPPAFHGEVHDALRTLSTQQRAVVFLTYWCDLAPREIALLLGISEGSVRKQLARGRARLREELG